MLLYLFWRKKYGGISQDVGRCKNSKLSFLSFQPLNASVEMFLKTQCKHILMYTIEHIVFSWIKTSLILSMNFDYVWGKKTLKMG